MSRLFLFSVLLFPFFFCSTPEKPAPPVEAKPAVVVPREYPTTLFSPPLHRPMGFSGVFAEIRLHHFHTGIDLRVGGVIGDPVYAVADGYVYRVRVLEGGGGKILAIAHPEGYITYYMHLNAYAGDIERMVRDLQRKQQAYTVDTLLPPGAMPVRRGDLVAYVGNTGGSAGPHLHFEIRDATASWCFNPLLFGFDYDDATSPTIRGVRLYPADAAATVAGKREARELSGDQVTVAGPFYLGVYATDASTGSTLRNGIRRIEVSVDGAPFFHYQVDSIPLGHGYLVNPVIDYDYYCAHRQGYILTRRLKGMRDNPITWASPADGVLRFAPGTTHKVTVAVYDCKHNRSVRTFTVRAEVPGAPQATAFDGRWQRFPVAYERPFRLRRDAFEVDMPAQTLFDDDTLRYDVTASDKCLSPIYHLRTSCHALPPRHSYRVAIRCDQGRSVAPDKLLMALRNEKDVLVVNPVTDSAGWYVATVYGFGQFYLTSDTKAPTVKPVNFQEGGTVRTTQLKVKVGDNLSGVTQYKCYLNGNWVLAAYDRKVASLIIDAAADLVLGDNQLRVTLADACGNSTDVTYRFRYSNSPAPKAAPKAKGKKKKGKKR